MTQFHLHLVSDATGETLDAVVKAALVQFEGADAIEHFYPLVRTPMQMERVLQEIETNPGIVLFTLVDRKLRRSIEEGCGTLDVRCIAILDPVLNVFGGYLGEESLNLPGQQHKMNAAYFNRIDAMNYTMAHDDGQQSQDIHRADIVLLGVSRTSKTPTSVYLANRGLKVANVPIVPGVPLPDDLKGLSRPMFVGLTANYERLVQVRRNRLRALGQSEDSEYVDPEAVREEISMARRMFTRKGWPVIDVTRRSIEETAASIYNLYQRRGEGSSGTKALEPVLESAKDF